MSEVLDRQGKDDTVNHPAHYNKAGIECIDCINACIGDYKGVEAYYAGNVIKYIYRANLKGGIESLKKAKWYLDKLVESYENTHTKNKPAGDTF